MQEWLKRLRAGRAPGRPEIAGGAPGDERLTCEFCLRARTWLTGLVEPASRGLLAAWRAVRRSLAPALRRLGVGPGPDHEIDSTRQFRKRPYSGSRDRIFELYVPRRARHGAPVPLVMVLHGCGQTGSDIRRVSNFDAIADREGFIVVYPHVTTQSFLRMENCWGWWLGTEIRPGSGQVEDLWQIVEDVRADFPVDERRIHVAGLSSGGGMAVAAMVAHADRIASGAVVAGLPYAETPRALTVRGSQRFLSVDSVVRTMQSVLGEHGRPSPVFVVHSHDDALVDIQAAVNIRDSWAQCHGVEPSLPCATKRGTTKGTGWVHEKFMTGGRRTAVETLFIHGPDHGWYGGSPGKFSYTDAPDITAHMWRFFRRNPLGSA